MNVKELYEKINGNYQSALNTMMMDDFIKKMLTKFVQTNQVVNLINAYENKDYPGVFSAAHSLKGVTGNLALDSLYNRLVPIVEKTRNSTPNSEINIDQEMSDFCANFDFVISELKAFLNL